MSRRFPRPGSFVALTLILFVLGPGPAVAAAQSGLDLGALGRPAEEVARDASSKPLDVYEFLDIGPGSVVADLIAGGGYNTAILTHLVGSEGVVFSQDGRRGAIAARKASGDLKDRANVVAFAQVGELPADSLDVALTVRNYHDVPPDEIPAFLEAVKKALEPGGVLGIVDVRAKPGGDPRPAELHRISEEVVVQEVTAAGFELEERSELLGNPNDAYESSEFEDRDGTDRMLLKFRKAAGGEAAHPQAGHAGGMDPQAGDEDAGTDEEPDANRAP